MNPITHFVRCEGAFEFFDDFLPRRKIDNRQRLRGMFETIEVLVQFEDATVVESKPFPDCVPALDCGIERTDSGFVAMHELTVDVDDQVAVLGIKFLKHKRKINQEPRKAGKN